MSERKTPVIAETIRRLLDRWAFGEPLDPWLEFPQDMCCFIFDKRRAIPIGALKILWGWGGHWFKRSCYQCGSTSYAVAFGGLMHISSFFLTCIGCDTTISYPGPDGIESVAKILIDSPLYYSEFKTTHGWFGGAQQSDGAALLKALGIEGKPETLGKASLTITLPTKEEIEKAQEKAAKAVAKKK